MADEASKFEIHVFTIFPEIIEQYCNTSILGRAQRAGIVTIVAHDLRHGASDAHRSVDDSPFGGGAGMVLAPEPVFAAVEAVPHSRPLWLLSASGARFDHNVAMALAEGSGAPSRPQSSGGPGTAGAGGESGDCEARGFSLLCGRYEGVDERIAENLVDGELSIGDYVLAGGELAALVVIEAVARLLPGVLGNSASPLEETFATGLVEHPQYTRPAEFRGHRVPEVLLSGDHARIEAWRRATSLWRTATRRPDLLNARGGLSPDEARLVVEHGYPLGAAEADSNMSAHRACETPPQGA